ncbi:helix-turn-helix transcriptional regulator [Paraburkholderia sp. RL17-347-BIC-D]|uniref:helix-turn-helix transcriptional regulator n=1 Tax=Paraburkholderia sp. RL17-347-BIC-D TaxID=3031632 RepID=UPI0038BDECE9
MKPTEQRQKISADESRGNLAAVIEGIGTERFGTALAEFLRPLSGVDHCTVFQLGGDAIDVVALSSCDPRHPMTLMVEHFVNEEIWRKDPVFSKARTLLATTSRLIRLDVNDMNDRAYLKLRTLIYPQAGDGIVVCGRRDSADFCLSVVRDNPNQPFGPEATKQLSAVADTLISAIAKHVSVLAHRPNVKFALTDLSEIEKCLIARSDLRRREVEVCARIIVGLSAAGISLDLGVGEETVKTYRKRAYSRLNIGCERELLHWYVSQWSTWRGYLNAPQHSISHEPQRATKSGRSRPSH